MDASHHRGLLDALQEAVWLVDAHGLTVLQANEAARQLLGLSSTQLVGRRIESLCVTPEDLLFWSEVAGGACEELHTETLMRHADGHTLWVDRRARLVQADSAHPLGRALWVVSMRDLSAQRRGEEEREALLVDLRSTLESTADGILVTDLAGRLRNFNQRFATLWGIPEDLLQQRDDAAVQAWMRRSVPDGAAYAARLAALLDAPLLQSSDVIQLLDGRVLERVSLPQWSRQRPVGRVFSFRDLSDQLAASQRIEELSHTDMLTGLPNRRALSQRVEYARAIAKREHSGFAMLFVDLDRFKQINDTLGHAFGDRVLREVAQRLRDCLREVDTVAKLSGDEFALLIHEADARGAEHTARRVLEAMGRPFGFDALSFTVTASIGIALFPGDGESLDELTSSAERAMQGVKDSGRAGFRFHQPRKDVDLLARMRLDHAMRQALLDRRFRLHYQPQLDLASGQVIGAEALIRWRDPLRGEVSPVEFIPVAEESGFIVAIGDWVLHEAVAQAQRWWQQGRRMPVAVNVSALQFQQGQFVDTVREVLKSAGLPPDLLELELTESILLRDADEALRRLQALAELGVCLSIDDFGTGYSSLAYLKRFPIQRLKIDRSFVQGLPADASDAGIVRAVAQMGRALGLQVIAEGVENEAQRDFLREAGCHEYQGYLFSPALDLAAFETRVWGTERPAIRLVQGGVG
ncbi:putative bifunctional diguanylate cyclase/phosphodiesterase [Pelomonas sp. BJYL3]|uniref:putative bifunctional diguanylate cyclase/phosphodiesterase n=1 Tax=Pelomonas sp. BJYL3 TaxID=2976697 RepID=UPI0022B30E10|nr:EAL domain-containing protein [Pelomonas sp. BJYL3]